MANIELHLKSIASSVEPTSTQKDGARRSHTYLREILKTGQMEKRISGDFLSGSYARDTAIHPLDDVDIIFLIDPSHWEIPFFRNYPLPEKVLESFANAIRYRYKESSVVVQRRSVCLKMHHLDIDVVPAIAAGGRDGRYIRIPDKNVDEWILTGPKIHEDVITDLNKSRNGLIKPLVKILKNWNNNLPSTARFKSFAIETIVVRLFQHVALNSLQEGLLYFFDFLSYAGNEGSIHSFPGEIGVTLNGWDGQNVPDIAETESNIVKNLDRDCRKKFIESAIRSRDKIKESIEASRESAAILRANEALRI